MLRSERLKPTPAETRLENWRERVSDAYFELELEYADPAHFDGRIVTFDLDGVALSWLKSDPLRYRRLASHVGADADENFLLTVPDQAPIQFSQRGRTTICGPGSFTLERSGEPYEFSYSEQNLMRVLKIPAQLLRRRIGNPDRLCAMRFDAQAGAGALFADYLSATTRHAETLKGTSAGTVGTQLLDLLSIVLEGAKDPGDSQETSVQAAHLRRIEHYIRTHLSEPDLGPATIAQACGVSVRYLHKLFRNTGCTVAETIRELRLEGCHEAILHSSASVPLSNFAYAWGFSDQSHFCRSFKSHFGVAPGEARRRALAARRKA